ncbi:MAG: Gfo/Idh/MocA family oxidoreductase [Silicimonas sp.]|nr:Gfo/Idh/MocA family oxidoreductase [Silicimonas sp.]
MGQQYFVIGAGSIGRRHHTNLTALGADSRLVPWRDVDLGALERDLAAADSPAVVIATATPVRFELVRLCAGLGAPVYIEKPMAYRLDDLEHIFAAAEPIAHRSVVGLMMRYHPAVRAQVAAGLETYGFTMEIGHDVRQWRANWRFADSYAAQSEGGGVLLDLCHEIDMAYCLYPALTVQTVDCLGHRDFPGVDFATRITLAAPDGPIGQVAMDYLSPKSIRRMHLSGRDEVVDLDLLVPEEVRSGGGDDRTRRWDFERNDMFLDLMRDFMAMAEGRPPSDNPLLPRLDRMYDSAALIATAWEKRRFHGALTGGFE